MKLKIKNWFEKNKDKIFVWFCVGLIAISVLLVVLFQRFDVENMNKNNKADIILNDDFYYNKSYYNDSSGNLHSSNLINQPNIYLDDRNWASFNIVENVYYWVSFDVVNNSNFSFNSLELYIDIDDDYFTVSNNQHGRFIGGFVANSSGSCQLSFEGYEADYNIFINNIMVNTGICALGYEPYGVIYYSSSNYNDLDIEYNNVLRQLENLYDDYQQLQNDYASAYENGYNEGINSALLNENNNNILLSSVVIAKGYQNNSLLYTSNQFDSVYDDNFKLTFLTSNIGYNPLNESDYLTSIYFEFSSPITINSNYFFYVNSLPSPNYHLTFYLDDSIILDLNYTNDSLPFPITFNNEYTFNRIKVYNTYSQENQVWNASFGTSSTPYWYYLGSGSQVSGYASGYQIGFNDGLSEGHSNGFQEGLNSSYSLGYQDGYNVGIQQDVTNSGFRNLFNSILSYPINFISSVFNFEFMGINVASVVLFLVSIGVVLFVIKKLWK